MPERGSDGVDDARAVDAIDAYWDALVDGPSGATGTPPDLDPALGETVRLVQGLPAPRPDAAFVARLEEELMMGTGAAAGGARPAAMTIGPTAGPATNGRWAPPRSVALPARRRLWGRAVEAVAAAALVVAILGGLVAGWGLRPERSGRAPTGAPGIAQATPPAEGGGTAMDRGNAARTGELPGPGPAGEPERRWRVPLAAGRSGVFARSPTVVDGLAYLTGYLVEPDGTDGGAGRDHLLAVDAATGEERWRAATTASPDEYASAPAVADGLLYVGTTAHDWSATTAPGNPAEVVAEPRLLGGFLVALDARTGEERWRVPTGGSGASSPATVDGVVYAAGEDGSVAAFDAATGAPRWRTAIATPDPAVDEDWGNALAVAGGLVYAVDGARTLHALDAATGAPRWRFAGAGTDLTTPVVADGLVYVGSNTFAEGAAEAVPGRLHALDAATGAERWSHEVRFYVDSPTVGAGHVFLLDDGDDGAAVVALDAASGAERWSFGIGHIPHTAPALVAGTLYVSGYERGLFNAGISHLGAGTSLFALDAATGEERWRIGIGNLSVGDIAVGADLLYVVDGPGGDDGDAGTLTAYGAD